VVYANDLDDVHNRYWYIYAEADDGARWRGDYPMQVHPFEAFNVCLGTGSSGLATRGFREIDVQNADEYTLTFVP